MKNPTGVIAEKIHILNRQVETNFSNIFTSLGKSIIGYVFNKPHVSAQAVLDLKNSFKLKPEPGHTLYYLILSSLVNAIHNLSKEHFSKTISQEFKNPIDNPQYISFLDSLNTILEKEEILITNDFLINPSNLPLLTKIQDYLIEWWTFFGDNKIEAENNSSGLPLYFTIELNRIWRASPEQYEKVGKFLETPFTPEIEENLNWFNYYFFLQKSIEERVFGEEIKIKDIYIPLRGYLKSKNENNLQENFNTQDSISRNVVWVEKELDLWLSNNKSLISMKVVTGGPGSGKSTLVKMWTSKISTLNKYRILFIPLNHFDVKDDLSESLKSYIELNSRIKLKENPLSNLDKSNSILILVFDGLDELSKQGAFAEDLSRKFIDELHRNLLLINSDTIKLKILLTGRELAVQHCEDKFRKQSSIIYLLPYLVLNKNSYKDKVKALNIDQRDNWWNRYLKLKNIEGDSMPSELKNIKKLKDITKEPLLNYLVALTWKEKNIEFSESTNLNEIYSDLIKQVYNRNYENSIHKAISDLEELDFSSILEQIALAAWQGGDVRTTTIKSIEKRIETSGKIELLNKYKEKSKTGINRLLTAFYFREHSRDKQNVQYFEFTHKSFGEYLAAKSIISLIDITHEGLELNKTRPSLGWTVYKAICEWLTNTADSPLDFYIIEFIENEIKKIPQEKVIYFKDTLASLVNYCIKEGLPMEALKIRSSNKEESILARNVGETLFILHNICCKVLKQQGKLNWTDKNGFMKWTLFLSQGYNSFNETLAYQHLSFLNYDNQSFHINFHKNSEGHNYGDGANFFAVDFRNSSFVDCNLSCCNMWSCDFTNSVISNADLTVAKLQRSNFTNSSIIDSTLFATSLTGCTFKKTKLKGSRFRSIDLTKVKINYSQFLTLEKLIDCEGIPKSILKKLKLKKPKLFTNKK